MGQSRATLGHPCPFGRALSAGIALASDNTVQDLRTQDTWHNGGPAQTSHDFVVVSDKIQIFRLSFLAG